MSHIGGDGFSGDRAGFAAADALVALMILSTALVLSLGALQTAKRAATTAAETSRATTLLRTLLDGAPRTPASQGGVEDGFGWTLTVAPSTNPSGLPSAPLCERTASARNLKSGHNYVLADEAICPPATAS